MMSGKYILELLDHMDSHSTTLPSVHLVHLHTGDLNNTTCEHMDKLQSRLQGTATRLLSTTTGRSKHLVFRPRRDAR